MDAEKRAQPRLGNRLRDFHKAPTRPLFLVMTFKNGQKDAVLLRTAWDLRDSHSPLPLAGFQTFGDTLRSGRRRIHETHHRTSEDGASAITSPHSPPIVRR